MPLALLRPESLVIFQVQSLPKPLNGLGSMTSPRTSLDLNFDFQTTLQCRFSGSLESYRFHPDSSSVFAYFLRRISPLRYLRLSSMISGGERILPFTHPDFNPPIHLIFRRGNPHTNMRRRDNREARRTLYTQGFSRCSKLRTFLSPDSARN